MLCLLLKGKNRVVYNRNALFNFGGLKFKSCEQHFWFIKSHLVSGTSSNIYSSLKNTLNMKRIRARQGSLKGALPWVITHTTNATVLLQRMTFSGFYKLPSTNKFRHKGTSGVLTQTG